MDWKARSWTVLKPQEAQSSSSSLLFLASNAATYYTSSFSPQYSKVEWLSMIKKTVNKNRNKRNAN